MRKTILLFVALSLMLLLGGCSTDKKETVLGTYQFVSTGGGHNYFMFVEKTDEKNKYKTVILKLKENSEKAEEGREVTFILEAVGKAKITVSVDNIPKGMYYPEHKVIVFDSDICYLKISDKKLSIEEMKKHIRHYY